MKSELFHLLRIALGNESDLSVPEGVDWSALVALATEQGVAGVAYDGLQKCYEANPKLVLPFDRDQKTVKYDWFGSVLSMEIAYEEHHQALTEICKMLSDDGIKVLLMKGYGLSLLYPISNHRPSGDIDIYCFDDFDRANSVIRAQGIKVDNSHHKHSVCHLGGQMVELHHSFLNSFAHRSTAKIERILEDIVSQEEMIPVEGFWIPSANFNALYLLRHMAEHFASTGCTLRHLLDWALFCQRFGADVTREWYQGIIREVGMSRFLWITNRMCVKYLGLPEESFGFAGEYRDSRCDDDLVDRAMGDILSREFGEKAPAGFWPGLAFKFRRWRANGWKHDIVFSESRLVSFLTQTWSHLLKPATMK